MARRSAPPRRCGQLDRVAPTAVAAVEARRQAQRTLRDIDALLALDSKADSSAPRRPREVTSHEQRRLRRGNNEDATPGPGSYDPRKERTQWQRHASVALHRATRTKDKTKAVRRFEHARVDRTPGPGAYDVAAADHAVKPRVCGSAAFRPEDPPRGNTKSHPPQVPALSELEPSKADKWLSRYTAPKGAVAYKPATAASTAMTREQRDRLRRVRLEKTRHKRVGFYTVRFALTERRTGALGVVAMDKSTTTFVRGSARHTQARTRRQLRAWHVVERAAASTTAAQVYGKGGSETAKPVRATKTTTIQWQRARARALLQQRDTKLSLALDSSQRERGRDLVAHAMAKHSGRDTVRCPRKNVRVTTAFTSGVRKEPWQRHAATEISSVSMPRGATGGVVTYETMQGREAYPTGAHGIYLLGQERKQQPRFARVHAPTYSSSLYKLA